MPNDNTLYCIPHSHWEGAVFKTRAEYLEIGLPHILQALQLLKTYPEYRYTIDQACYVRPFLERYPAEAESFRRFVEEGRLAIVGGTDVMLDVNMPGGESFVRQVLYGKGYFRRALGINVTTGWQLDTFGHHAQMPQLLKLAGFTAFWFFRGVASWQTPSEFRWEGLDGSRIHAIWLPQGYCNLYGSPQSLPEFTACMAQRYTELAPQAPGDARVGIAANDVAAPEAHLPVLLAQFNAQPERPFRLQFAIPADFEKVACEADLPVIGGELNPIFQGIYSSRIELKQRTRELEVLLTTAEKLGVMLHAQGIATEQADMWRAWEPMLFNQAHDLMSGVMTDGVYADTLRGYDFSARLATEGVDSRLQSLIDRIDTRGAGIPLVVFNSLGWARTDLVETTVGFSEPGIRGVTLIDPDGQEIPLQILRAERHADGTLITATVAFVGNIPALGYAVYHLLPQITATPASIASENNTLDNGFYHLEIDPASGAINRLLVKAGEWEALANPGNVVALEEDHGDLWELYQPLDPGSRIAMTNRHEPPTVAQFSTEQTSKPGCIVTGPVISEFTVAHPLGKGQFRTTIRLVAGLPRIDIRTTIRNEDAGVRYRVLFPTTIADGRNVQEIPFGASERPEGIEFPAQNWVNWGNETHGITLLNRGLPGNNVAAGTLMLSLLRSTSIVAYGYGGGYEPGMGSESGLEMGQELTFDYALCPHAGDWRQASPWRDGQAFNHPLIARTAAAHAGPLPARWGLLEIAAPNVVLSALKMSEDGTHAILRVYEAAGESTETTITIPGCVTAEEVNLLEEPLQPLPVADGQLHVMLRPFEIKSYGLQI